MTIKDKSGGDKSREAAALQWTALPTADRDRLWHAWVVSWVYHSNAIEGSKVSEAGSALLIDDPQLNLPEYSQKDQRETRNHAAVLNEIVWPAISSRKLVWTIEDIHAMHARLLHGHAPRADEPLGAWRGLRIQVNNVDGSSSSNFTFPEDIGRLMDMWLASLNAALRQPALNRESGAGAFVNLHVGFTRIHPYFDGNGRMARLVSNIPLLMAGLPPLILPTGELERAVYWGYLARHGRQTGLPRDEESLVGVSPVLQTFTRYCFDMWEMTWRAAADAVVEERIR